MRHVSPLLGLSSRSHLNPASYIHASSGFPRQHNTLAKMMQSKLAGNLTFALRNQILPRISRSRNLGAITGGGRTADPAVHAVDPEEKNDASEGDKAAPSTNSAANSKPTTTVKDEDPYVSPGCLLSGPSPKVQSSGVNNQPPELLAQQKRRLSSLYSYSSVAATDVDCVGIDGSPLAGKDKELDSRGQREEQEKENKEYFEKHRASPLSELEMADTRKPITQATSGSEEKGYFGSPEVKVWRPEQVDTAEDSLRRAREIWMSNAIRGDPDSPHGKILRTLRGEFW